MQNNQKLSTNPTPEFVIRLCMPHHLAGHVSCSIFYESKADPYDRLYKLVVDDELINHFYDLDWQVDPQSYAQELLQDKTMQQKFVARYHLEGFEGNLLPANALEQLKVHFPHYSSDMELQVQVTDPSIPWESEQGKGFRVTASVWGKGASGYGIAIHEVLFHQDDVSAVFTGGIGTRLFGDALVDTYREQVDGILTKQDMDLYQLALLESLDTPVEQTTTF